MSHKLIPFILLLSLACTDDHSKDKMRQTIEIKNNEASSLATELTASESERQSLATELENQRSSVSQLERTVTTNSETVSQLEKSVADKTAAVMELEKRSNEDRANALALKAVVVKATDEKAALEAKLAEAQSALATSQKDLELSKETLKQKEETLLEAINDLTSDIQKKNNEIQALNTRLATTATNATAEQLVDLQSQLDKAKTELSTLEKSKVEIETKLAETKSIVVESLAPLWGMYYGRKTMTFDNVSCRELVYVKDQGGSVQAIVCEDGRMQVEHRDLKSFSALSNNAIDGDVGLEIKSSVSANSCGTQTSIFKALPTYAFDRGSQLGRSDLAPSLMTTLNARPSILENAALNFTSNECEDLIALKDAGSIKDPGLASILDMTVRLCKVAVTPELSISTDLGCFSANNVFNK